MVYGFLSYHSRLEPLCRTLIPRLWCLRLLNRVGPHIVGTHRPRLLPPGCSFARERIAAVQSRVAAPVLSDPRPPPPVPAFSPFRDGHYWCSKCPRRGFTTIPGLMRHVTHQHAGSSVDEATCSLFAAIERVTCTAPACGGLRRMGARVCNRCGQASQARPPRVGDVIMNPLVLLPVARTWPWPMPRAPATPSLAVKLLLVDLPVDFTQRIRAPRCPRA